jgi:short-subunit dehydrogenase
MTGFTKCLQLELLPSNISVMGFYPGFIHTDIFKHAGYERTDFSKAMTVEQCAKILAYMIEIDSDLIINDLEVQSTKYF